MSIRALRLAAVTGSVLLFQSCSPASLIHLYNDTGAMIIVTTRGGSLSVSPHSFAQFGLVLATDQHWESLTITAHGKTWRYLQRVFTRIPWEAWQRGPFESRNAFVRLDSRGRIYLTAADGTTVSQPSGFPLLPEKI
jgi:hypothetical protein